MGKRTLQLLERRLTRIIGANFQVERRLTTMLGANFQRHRQIFFRFYRLRGAGLSGAVGSSVEPPCQSGERLRWFQESQAALRSATMCGWEASRLFFSPMSLARL